MTKTPMPTLLGDLEAMGVNTTLLACAVAASLGVLVIYSFFAKPSGSARLTYFNGQGRAEEVRLMLALCNVPWRDAVYGDATGAQYATTEAQMRKMMAAGVLAMDQLPLLEIDGLRLVQQSAILRYLARRHNLYGSGAAEAAQIDILSDSLQDWNPVIAVLQGKADAPHAKYLDRFARALRSNGDGDFLVGKTVSFVDVQVFQALEQLVESKTVPLKAKWPELDAYRLRVRALPPIAEYLGSGRQVHFFGPSRAKETFFAEIAKVIPWNFGKAEHPGLLCKEWRFRA